MYTPVNPRFTIQECGLRGYTLHGHVFLEEQRTGWQTVIQIQTIQLVTNKYRNGELNRETDKIIINYVDHSSTVIKRNELSTKTEMAKVVY